MTKRDSNKTTQGCNRCPHAGRGETSIERRDFLRQAGSVLPLLAISRYAAAQESSEQDNAAVSLPPQAGDRLTFYAKSKRGKILKVDDIPLADKQILVLPMDKETGVVRDGSRYNPILLQKFATTELDEATLARSADGVVAYSAICTHTGCLVSSWDRKQQAYMCPCHQSVYDPRNSAGVVSGPAPRSLPGLPVGVENDELIVAGDFNQAVGFGKNFGPRGG